MRLFLVRLFVFCLTFGILFSGTLYISSAQVVINEFLPNPNDETQEWVEFYNSGSSEQNLQGYYFDDDSDFGTETGSTKVALNGMLQPQSLCFLTLSSFLNNAGDTPTLFDSGGATLDTYTYTLTTSEKSFSRVPDGGSWQADQTPTKTAVSCSSLAPPPTLLPTPSPTATSVPASTTTSSPSPTTSPTQTATPTIQNKAIYNLLEAKDESGIKLSNVKVYVDNVYLKHFTPETITFCDGCKCDGLVNCGLGKHTIKCTKDGYEDWSETITIAAGQTYDKNPILKKTADNTAQSATGTKSPSVTAASPGILGQKDESGVDLNPSKSNSFVTNLRERMTGGVNNDADLGESKINDSKFPIQAVLLTGAGFSFAGSGFYLYIKNKKNKSNGIDDENKIF